MQDQITLCEVCNVSPAKRIVSSQLFPEKNVAYCNECVAEGGEPYMDVMRYLDIYEGKEHHIPHGLRVDVAILNDDGEFQSLDDYLVSK